jgi:hypothetical protein
VRAFEGITSSGFNTADVKKLMRKVTIYIVRVSSSGELKSSGPCINCLSVIREVGIRKMMFSEDDGSIKEYNTNDYTRVHLSLGTRCFPVASHYEIKNRIRNRIRKIE